MLGLSHNQLASPSLCAFRRARFTLPRKLASLANHFMKHEHKALRETHLMQDIVRRNRAMESAQHGGYVLVFEVRPDGGLFVFFPLSSSVSTSLVLVAVTRRKTST